MKDIPFEVYDFFGYLAPGFLILVALDLAFFGSCGDKHFLLRKDLGIVFGILWVGVAYITGHILAGPSAWVLERMATKKWLRAPSITLFWKTRRGFWSKVFAHYLEQFPEPIRTSLLKKFKKEIRENSDGSSDFEELPLSSSLLDNENKEEQQNAMEILKKAGSALYLQAYGRVQNDALTMARLDRFLVLYGFSRNISFGFGMAVFIILLDYLITGNISGSFVWIGLCCFACIALFFCYLKFLRFWYRILFLAYLYPPQRGGEGIKKDKNRK